MNDTTSKSQQLHSSNSATAKKSTPARMSDRNFGLMMAVATGLCWAVLAIMLKVALQHASAYTIAWYRLSFAFLIVFVLIGIRTPQDLKILVKPPLMGLIAGVGLALNYLGYMKGVEYTSPSNAQIFIQLAPMTVLLFGIFYFKEKPGLIQIVGFCLAALGFVFFFEDQLQATLANHDSYLHGNMWILFGAGTWVVFAILQKILLSKWTSPQLNLLTYGVSTIVLLPIVNWSDFLHLSLWGWVLLCLCGLNTVLAYGAYGIAMAKAPASEVSIVITMNPLITIVLMYVISLFNVEWIKPESISTLGFVGAGTVVLGVILAVQRRRDGLVQTSSSS